MKIVTIVGARPQFIKAAPISQALRSRHQEILVHTGQHYAENMSAVFFAELDLPDPDYHLGIGSGPQGAQTGAMLAAIEQVLVRETPDWVMIFGDTNSTLAGALAAAKLHIPIAHIEAGLRSFNRAMPEEINRVVADHLSTLLFCPSQPAARQLEAEGITSGVHVVGDVMLEALLAAVKRARQTSQILGGLALTPRRYLLATLHRAENTDDPARLLAILSALDSLEEPVVLPLHPRTAKALQHAGYQPAQASCLKIIEPIGYLDMAHLEENARLILTDSGGVQKEAYWLSVPCLTLRSETEWTETVELGWNTLVGADPVRILAGVKHQAHPVHHPDLFGDGKAAERIVSLIG